MTTITDREHLMMLEADLANAQERIAELEAALEPFAAAARYLPPGDGDSSPVNLMGYLRRARALLEDKP